MEIKGIGNLTAEQLGQEVQQGGRFVVFQYCISVIILTFKRPSSIYYICPGEGTAAKSWPFTVLSLIAGWWGFPWGPIYTIAALAVNIGGGTDVTMDIMNSIDNRPAHTTLV